MYKPPVARSQLTKAEWLGGYIWAGHNMIVTMQITCSTCRLSNFTRGNAPEHAKEYTYTGYLELKESKGYGTVKACMAFATYLAIHKDALIATAKWLVAEAYDFGGDPHIDACALALQQDMAMFQQWLGDERLEECLKYAKDMLTTDTYDMEFIRMAKDMELRIMDWYGE